jgi:S-DNA-T family DNA segregation ATPase FtsK/SpoIIIE
MPSYVDIDEMKNSYSDRNLVPIGIRYDHITNAYLQMNNTYCSMITGSIGSGKSALLCKIIEIIKSDENILYLFDSEKNTFSKYQNIAQGYFVDKNNNDVQCGIDEIVSELNVRQNELNSQSCDENFVLEEFVSSKKQICIFIDDINEFVENVENEQRDMMNNIARLAKDLGVMLFVAGRVADVSKLADIEPLTNTIVKYQNGIGLDGSPSMYNFFNTNNLSYSEKETTCENSDAWMFYSGNCIKVKLV